MAYFRKIKAGLVKDDIANFVGQEGNIFFNVATGEFRISDGITPGGLSTNSGNGTGSAGIQGIQGLTGAQGIQGVGSNGSQGIQGLTGAQGIQGVGSNGSQGITGVQGLQGIQGVGSNGIQGITGIQGLQGIQGVGSNGIQGLQGTDGLFAGQGIQGIQGTVGGGSSTTWIDYASNWLSEPILIESIPQGEVYQYTFSNSTAYRLVPTDGISIDSFYRTFNNSVLEILLAKRGDLT
jgi:hypothetical protein